MDRCGHIGFLCSNDMTVTVPFDRHIPHRPHHLSLSLTPRVCGLLSPNLPYCFPYNKFAPNPCLCRKLEHESLSGSHESRERDSFMQQIFIDNPLCAGTAVDMEKQQRTAWGRIPPSGHVEHSFCKWRHLSGSFLTAPPPHEKDCASCVPVISEDFVFTKHLLYNKPLSGSGTTKMLNKYLLN